MLQNHPETVAADWGILPPFRLAAYRAQGFSGNQFSQVSLIR